MKKYMLFLILPLISFGQITINETDKKSSTKINSTKKEIIRTTAEVEHVQKAIKKMKTGLKKHLKIIFKRVLGGRRSVVLRPTLSADVGIKYHNNREEGT